MINLKEHPISSPKHVWYATFLLLFIFLLVVFFFGKTGEGNAASYTLTGLSPGFQGATCSGAAADWVAVRGDLRDAPTGNQINGTFTAACKADSLSGGIYYEGPDGVHSIARFGPKCAGGSAGLMGVVCMGSCTLPFNLSADATNYAATPTWLVNHEVGVVNTLYPEGNANTANYNIYLDRAACEAHSYKTGSCSGTSAASKDVWGNVCATKADTCTGWSNNVCGGGSCTSNQMRQTRNCTFNCASESKCVTDSCGAWTDVACGAGSCGADQMKQTRSCTYGCKNTNRCVASSSCGGTILGRVYIDDNANGTYDTGERLVQNGVSCGTPLSFTLGGVNVSYSGASSGSRNPNLCNSDPYYSTGLLPTGDYSVSVNPPAGWFATTPAQTASLGGGNAAHRWFGIVQGPIAEASIAKTLAGPWANVVVITNTEPDVDKSKDPNFYLSALKDRTGDGLASYDPKGGSISCTWDYDVDNSDPSTEFTGCEFGDGEYIEAKRQEMISYWKAKLEGTYTNIIELTVTDSNGLTDTDVVGILKEPPPPPPKINLFDIDPQCDVGTPFNKITWEVDHTTSYELKACEGGFCTTSVILSGSFVSNPTSFTHKPLKDETAYTYQLIAHGPGGDTESDLNVVESKNCKGEILLVVYIVDEQGERIFPLPSATVKLTDPSGTTVYSSVLSDANGLARFSKLIPGTYGVLAYKNKFDGKAKQAGDCTATQYSTVNATIGPNTVTSNQLAAWDDTIPVAADTITFCHDLGLTGIPPLAVTCRSSFDPLVVGTETTWEAEALGGEGGYTYAWSGDDGLSGNTKTVKKTYTTTGNKRASVTVNTADETDTATCNVTVIPVPVCNESSFPLNKFYVCYYDYNFDSSPGPSTIRDGTFLASEDESSVLVFGNGRVGSAVGFNHVWSGGIAKTDKSDNVGGVWQANIHFKDELYKFVIEADDGVQLTVDLDGDGSLADETPLIDRWQKQSTHIETNFIPLDGLRKIQLLWFEGSGDAKISLRWHEKTCDWGDLNDKFHVCFYKGKGLDAGVFLGERDDAAVSSPAPRFNVPFDHNYFGNAGEYGEIDDFSGIWRGVIDFPPGFYKFIIEANDGVRLDVGEDGSYEINEWSDQSSAQTYETGFIVLGGNTPIRLEWYENIDTAKIKLIWTPSVSFIQPLKRLFASLASFIVL